MENELIQQFKVWQGQSNKAKGDFIDHLKVYSPWALAHHPAHSCFREHVWKINSLYVCKGCMMTYMGFVAGLILQAITGWLADYSEETLALVFVGLLLPTLISSTSDWPRVIKHGSRFLLGLLIASSFLLLFITERWEVRIVVIATFLFFQIVYSRKRQQKNFAILQAAQDGQHSVKNSRGSHGH
ncbi:MAG: hypothetical protein AAFP10_08365 [Pseudomonadota bacterium]